MTGVFGILNLTRDSFSDGGRFVEGHEVDVEAAVAHGLALAKDGADVVDVGAEATNPDAEDVSAAAEMGRLVPVVTRLLREGVAVSVDTRKPEVMAGMAALGVGWLNDTAGFRSAAAVAAAASCRARLVVMHSTAASGRAERRAAGPPAAVAAAAVRFLAGRVEALCAAGVGRERIVVDPGMGLFLGPDPAASLAVLRELGRLREQVGLPVLVSVSRKGFLGALTGRPAGERGAATLAAELFAARHADWIRTHDVRALRDGLAVFRALGALPGGGAEIRPHRG